MSGYRSFNLPQFDLILFSARLVYSTATLYMLFILLRWLAPHLQWDMGNLIGRLIAHITDPLLNAVRRTLPAMGPFDFAPLASVLLIMIGREIATTLFLLASNH